MAKSLDMDAMADDELQSRIDRGDYVGEELDDLESLQDPTEELDEDDLDDTDEDEDTEDETPEDEEEDSEEEEGDEEGDEVEEEEDSDEVDEKPHMIPKSRMDEIIAQREEYKEQLAWMQEQYEKAMDVQAVTKPAVDETPVAPEFDFDAAEEKLMEAVIEDNKSEAAKLRSEIRKAQKAEMDYKVEVATRVAIEEATAHTNQSLEDQKFDALVETYESEYAFLDMNSESANEDAIDMVNTLLVGYMANDKSKSQALRAAVKKVAPLFKTPTAPAKRAGTTRKKAAVKKNVTASKRQPAQGRSSGVSDEEVINVGKMSGAAFRKLSEREKAVLRGDVV